MDATVSSILLLLFLWGLGSRRFARLQLTAPVAFVVIGYLMHQGVGPIDLAPSHTTVETLAEVTLTAVLFTDAARLSYPLLRPDLRLYLRLLLIGLPLAVGLGTLAALAILPAVTGWAALYVGAALAPTDSTLGVPMMTDPHVPSRVRRALNVEGGLNDGVATPFVVLALAGISAAEAGTGRPGPGGALADLLIGLAYGAAVGLAAGWLTRAALRRNWAVADFAGVAVLALALLSYASAVALGVNGFVAAFVAGIAFGTASRGGAPEWQLTFAEQSATALSLLVWLAFGAVILPKAFDHLTWQAPLYAVLSLTVLRMVPVALALRGTGFDRRTVLLVGWFGPRGLASIVFALLAVEELSPTAAHTVVPVVVCTVLLSVLAHGFTAGPLARRYAAVENTPPAPAGAPPPDELPVRSLGGGPPRR